MLFIKQFKESFLTPQSKLFIKVLTSPRGKIQLAPRGKHLGIILIKIFFSNKFINQKLCIVK